MPSKRKDDKRPLLVWISEELHAKFKKRAKSLGLSMSEIVLAYLLTQTKNIELTPEEYEDIAKKIRKRKAR